MENTDIQPGRKLPVVPSKRLASRTPALVRGKTPIPEGADRFMDVVANGTTYRVQRFCPHRGVDLLEYGVVNEDGSITCTAHSLCFDLSTGECKNGKKGRYALETEHDPTH